MPTFDARYIQAAKYNYDEETGKVSYTDKTKVGDAMEVNMELKFAEGRLYAEGRLAEYMKQPTGGTMSMAVKRILENAQKLLYGSKEHTRTVDGKEVKSLRTTAKDVAEYVGVSLYAPDKIDGVTKYTTMFVAKSLFGPPAYRFKTKGQTLEFNTPTTTGEFLADDSADEVLIDTAVVDTIEEAIAWCDTVLGGAAAAQANETEEPAEGDA